MDGTLPLLFMALAALLLPWWITIAYVACGVVPVVVFIVVGRYHPRSLWESIQVMLLFPLYRIPAACFVVLLHLTESNPVVGAWVVACPTVFDAMLNILETCPRDPDYTTVAFLAIRLCTVFLRQTPPPSPARVSALMTRSWPMRTAVLLKNADICVTALDRVDASERRRLLQHVPHALQPAVWR